MTAQQTPPNAEPANEALRYLREQLGLRAPATITPIAEFVESPLDGEGRTWLFAFDLQPGSGLSAADCASYDPRHIVAVGETTPNYFPSFGFSGDDAYSFHIGTRFMLEMGLQKVADELEPPDARGLLLKIVAGAAPKTSVTNVALAGLFRCEDGYYAVYRLLIDGTPHYALGADCPPGFYQLTQFPPQTTLRLHLGKLIRAEAKAG